MKNNDFERAKLDDGLNAEDEEKQIKDAFEKKRKRLLDNLKLGKEMQISKIEEDAQIQAKRINNFINFEMDSMIKTLKEKKEFNELKKKLKIDNYEITLANQESMMESLRNNFAPNDVVDKINKK